MTNKIQSEDKTAYSLIAQSNGDAIIARAIAFLEDRLQKPNIHLTYPQDAAKLCTLKRLH